MILYGFSNEPLVEFYMVVVLFVMVYMVTSRSYGGCYSGSLSDPVPADRTTRIGFFCSFRIGFHT